MTSKRLALLVVLLVLVLVVGTLAHGGNLNKTNKKQRGRMIDNCPTQPGIQEDNEFPETVKVHIPLAHAEPMNRRMPHDVKNRSLSPWDYSVKEDPNRFPHILSEASCRYTVCLDSTGKNLNYAVNSVPIQQEILVLKRKHIGCKQSYWLEKQVITVGCTCAFPTSNAYQKKVF